MPRSNASPRARGLAILAALAVCGCASAPRTFGYANADPMLLFPPAGAADPPRYAYVGDLIGETNLATTGVTEQGAWQRAWRFVAGIDSQARRRLDLSRPQCVATDPEGRRVYVSDAARKGVFAFDLDAGTLALWSRATTRLDLSEPVGIAPLAGGDVLVADAERRAVLRLDARGREVAAYGTGRLQRPTGLAVDPASGRIYVADTAAHRIEVFAPDGAPIAAFGRRGEAAGELNHPTHLAWRGSHLYVTDAVNARVQRFDADGRHAGTIGRAGLYVGELARPKGVAIDSAGHVIVVESLYSHVLVYDADGRFLLGWGGAGARPGEFHLPAGVWVDARDRIYVADMFNGRVSVFRALAGESP